MTSGKHKWRNLPIRILAIVGGLWLGWTTYALVVPESEDLVPQSILVDRFPTDPTLDPQTPTDLLGVLETVLQSPVTMNNQVELLINGDEIFSSMIEAIREAKHAIYLLTYVYWSGQIADEFATALGEAVDRGVEVRLLVDSYGARKMPTEIVDRIKSSGIRMVWFHPFEWYNVRQYNLRTHRKIMIVDNTVAFTGGVGIAEEWSGDARDPNEWRDDHFRIEGSAVKMLNGSFAENWLNATGEVLLSKFETSAKSATINPGPVNHGGARLMVLSTSPRGDMSPIAFTYWSAFKLATESINITTPYFVPDDALAKTLVATAQRGVTVNLLLPGEINDSQLVRTASFAFYDELILAGVNIYEYQPTMLHTKSIVIDNRWSLIGSPNFDNRSFELNDEILVVADDVALAKQINESFLVDISQSSRIALEPKSLEYWLRQLLAHLALTVREQI